MHIIERRLLRDVSWSAVGIGSAFGAIRLMEAFRPEVISDDVTAPENAGSVRALGRAYVVSAGAMAVGPFATRARLPAVCGPSGWGWSSPPSGCGSGPCAPCRGTTRGGCGVVEGQPVMRSGPYRVVRHPGYLSALLAWLGSAISTRNAVPVAVTLVAVGRAYRHRMDAEDALLIRDLPGYGGYAATTGRLLPRPDVLFPRMRRRPR